MQEKKKKNGLVAKTNEHKIPVSPSAVTEISPEELMAAVELTHTVAAVVAMCGNTLNSPFDSPTSLLKLPQ